MNYIAIWRSRPEDYLVNYEALLEMMALGKKADNEFYGDITFLYL